jgi:hypothetical protein
MMLNFYTGYRGIIRGAAITVAAMPRVSHADTDVELLKAKAALSKSIAAGDCFKAGKKVRLKACKMVVP